MSTTQYTAALLWPGPAGVPPPPLATTRLAAVADTLRARGIEPVPVVYSDEAADDVRQLLQHVDAVLVWVNPIENGRTRAQLDARLRDVAQTGVLVSAHPDVILAIGTKDVLYHTRDMPWGGDTRLYRNHAELCARFPAALASTGVRVLKQHRGNGGNGVWKVAPIAAADAAPPMVRVTHAQRGSAPQLYPLDQFMAQCAAYFDGDGPLIDQPFAPRLADGMVRCYMVGDAVVGFGEQKLNALLPAAPDGAPTLPGPRVYFPPTRADFQPLKTLLEGGWLAQLCARMGVAVADLPLVWDADFLFGPKTAAGHDTYVLCEINVSCVYPFPDSALDPLAELLARRLDQLRR